jgi:tripartite-type tricarboxylate transporter receptor subunit TctC
LSAVALLLTIGQPAIAQTTFPQKPITIVVGAPPGGANDIVARVVAQKLKLGTPTAVPIVVLNKPGAGGQISTDFTAAAAPDGYTLFLGTPAVTVGPFLRKSFTPLNKFTPIINLVTLSVVLSIDARLPVTNVADLKAYGVANPGKLAIGSSGGQLDLASPLLAEALGTRIKAVPFDGVAPVFTALLAGDVQLLFSTAAAARPFVESGKVKTIAGGGAKRDPLAPDLPTVAESGAPGFEVRPAWFGMMAPAGLPRELVDQLNKAFAAVLQDEEVAKRFRDLGMNIAGGSPEDLADVLKQDVAAFEKAAKLANISPQ